MANPNITVVGPRSEKIAPSLGQTLSLLMREKQLEAERERLNAQFQWKVNQQAREDAEKRLKFYAENYPDTPIPEYGEMFKEEYKKLGDMVLSGDPTEFYKGMGDLKLKAKHTESVWKEVSGLYEMAKQDDRINKEGLPHLISNILYDENNNLKDPFNVTTKQMSDLVNSPDFWDLQKSMDQYAAGVQDTIKTDVENQRLMGDFTTFDLVTTANKFASMKDGKVQYDPATGNIILNVTGDQVNRMKLDKGLRTHMDKKVNEQHAAGNEAYNYTNAAEDIIRETGYAEPAVTTKTEIKKGFKPTEGLQYLGGSAKRQADAILRVDSLLPILSYGEEKSVLNRIEGKPGIIDTKVFRPGDPNNPEEVKKLLKGAGALSDKKVIGIQYDARRMQEIPITLSFEFEGQKLSKTEKGRQPEQPWDYILVDPNEDTGGKINSALLKLNNWVNGTDPSKVSNDLVSKAFDMQYGKPAGEKKQNVTEELGKLNWK